jgi:hypothetical protein
MLTPAKRISGLEFHKDQGIGCRRLVHRGLSLTQLGLSLTSHVDLRGTFHILSLET